MTSRDDTKTYLSKREIPQLFEVKIKIKVLFVIVTSLGSGLQRASMCSKSTAPMKRYRPSANYVAIKLSMRALKMMYVYSLK